MKVIGLTGGIASGKSTVSNYLRELGAVILDADVIAREVVKPGEIAWQEIVQYFGSEILTPERELDRIKLGQIVFNNPEARRKLNQITHPRVKEEISKRLSFMAVQSPDAIAVVDAPLLIEAGLTNMVDEVWLVMVDEKTQVLRLIIRDKCTEEEACRRIASQMPLKEKLERADKVIDNNGTIENTLRQVDNYWNKLVLTEDKLVE